MRHCFEMNGVPRNVAPPTYTTSFILYLSLGFKKDIGESVVKGFETYLQLATDDPAFDNW